jgi:hypothetical protein
MATTNSSESMAWQRPLLIKLDSGFIMRIEAEREVLTGGTGHKIPRTAMIRMLLKEALEARQRARGEQVPQAIAVNRGPDGELADVEAA